MTSKPIILLAAHGARDESSANDLVRELAREVSARTGLPTCPAFNLGTPTFEEAIQTTEPASKVVVVPVMMANGYFATQVLPARIEAATNERNLSLSILEPLGAWDSVQSLGADRVTRALQASPTQTSVLLIGHGTTRDPDSSATTRQLASRISEAYPDVEVRAAFIDQEPRIVSAIRSLGADRLVVLPYLLGGGGHELEDVPRLIRDAGFRGELVILDAIGSAPDLPMMIADRVLKEITPRRPTLGTRGSRLALIQANAVAHALRRADCAVTVRVIDTIGDRDKRTPIAELPASSPFTDALEHALLRQQIDLATHSLKDLPIASSPGLENVAFLPRHDPSEALVSRDGSSLDHLPKGARVGSSSERRARQALALRPDLVIEPIRGDVESRVEQVKAGRFDATILAVAGLERLGLGNEIAQRFSFDEVAPEPGQGAIVIQARAGEVHPWVDAVDHVSTRRAVKAEITFAWLAEQLHPSAVCAARADLDEQGVINLRARFVGAFGTPHEDVVVAGKDPIEIGRSAAHELLVRSPSVIGGAA